MKIRVSELTRKYGEFLAVDHISFEVSRGEILGYLNSDDTLLPQAVSRLVATLEGDPALVCAYGDALWLDPGRSIRSRRVRPGRAGSDDGGARRR